MHLLNSSVFFYLRYIIYNFQTLRYQFSYLHQQTGEHTMIGVSKHPWEWEGASPSGVRRRGCDPCRSRVLAKYCDLQRQTAVAAHLKSKQLLLFAGRYVWTVGKVHTRMTPFGSEHSVLDQCWHNVAPTSTTLAQHYASIDPIARVHWIGVQESQFNMHPCIKTTHQRLPGVSKNGYRLYFHHLTTKIKPLQRWSMSL